MMTQITDGVWGYSSRQNEESLYRCLSHHPWPTNVQGKSRGKVLSRKDREVPKEE